MRIPEFLYESSNNRFSWKFLGISAFCFSWNLFDFLAKSHTSEVPYGWWTKLSHTMVRFVIWMRFARICCPRRAGGRTPKNYTNPKIFGFDQMYVGFTHFRKESMQTTPRMHLNTSPTCFEGPLGWKIGFGCCLIMSIASILVRPFH